MSADSATGSLPRSAAGAPDAPAALRVPGRLEPPALQMWAGLWTIYLVWGSTYVAIRVMVETMPPLLGAGLRFQIAGAAMLAFLLVRRGRGALAITSRQLLTCLAIGTLLTGANALVTVTEQEVPAGIAALLIASVPLVVIVLRALAGEGVRRGSAAAVAVGFVGVAVLLLPGERPEGASLLAMLGTLFAAVMWACGSFASPRADLPRDPVVTTAWQITLGGLVCSLTGLAVGEAGDVDPGAFSTDSLLAWAYLVVVGSILAFTAYAWLLQNVRVSKVATYAYVNPIVAIVLGWLLLDESIAVMTLVGAAIVVASVAFVIRLESGTAARTASRARSASASA